VRLVLRCLVHFITLFVRTFNHNADTAVAERDVRIATLETELASKAQQLQDMLSNNEVGFQSTLA